MSNLDPYAYKNGEPVDPAAAAPVTGSAALAVGETVSSESPKVSLGKSKAIVAAIAGLAVSVGPVLTVVLADGAIDVNEGILLGIAVLAGLGVPGIGAYVTPTKVTRNR